MTNYFDYHMRNDMETHKKPSIIRTIKDLLTLPINSWQHWGIIIAISLVFIHNPFPQGYVNDWKLITDEILLKFSIYTDPNSVYPPWSLIVLWPYYFMTAAGSRVASVLVVGWLATRERWSLLKFGAVIASPYFLWTMRLSNIDILVLLFPVLIWEKSTGRSWQWLGRFVSIVILLIKPQAGGVMILYLIYRHRKEFRNLVLPLVLAALVIIPISLVGSPPLFMQWLNNTVFNPSETNLSYWSINNISLTTLFGLPAGIIISAFAFGGIFILRRLYHKRWTQNHTLTSIFLLSMVLGPYASNQGMIVPLALVTSWPALILLYILSVSLSALGVFIKYSALWAVFFGVLFLWFYNPVDGDQNH